MASSHLGAAVWLINESWAVYRSSVNSWVGFRNKRFRRQTQRWRFGVEEISSKDKTTKHQLVDPANRSESLKWILNKYGIPGDKTEASNERRRRSDLGCEEKFPEIPSSAIRDSRMTKIEQSSDPSVEENQWETAATSHHVSSRKTYNFTQLNAGAFFMLPLLPMVAFCIGCILGALHGRISENTTANGSVVHHHGSERSRWKSILSESVDGSDSWPDYRVTSGEDEAPEEVSRTYSRVERDYQRFLSECGMSEHGYWRGGSS